MPLLNLLAVLNPADYWRGGQVALPWQPLAEQFQLTPESLVVTDLRDHTQTPLLAQVDRLDPEDPARDVLRFALRQAIPPGGEGNAGTFIRLDRGQPVPSEIGEPSLEIVHGPEGEVRGVRLVNNRLIVWFNLVQAPEEDTRDWFGGSATSIQLDRQELLDPFQAAQGEWQHQDPEKRYLQIAGLQLPGLPYPKSPYYSVYLFNHSYRLVAHNRGPVRASITIASEPFDYIGADPVTGMNRHLLCELYRVISLEAGATYLTEDLWVKGKPRSAEDSGLGPEVVDLSFAPQFFAHVPLGQAVKLYQPPHVPGWFAIAAEASPYPGFGFATDLHLDTVQHPYEGDPQQFSWRLLPGKSARCLHLFWRNQPGGGEAHTGRSWYELIYQPLQAEIYEHWLATPSAQTGDRGQLLAGVRP